ncbi:MAG: nuclear transport factor 2 family protein [Actinomycetota bacterium]|nr:nuclear transport factor 2 family protein [Actinomycetota bacterium]
MDITVEQVADRYLASLVHGKGADPEIFAPEVSLWWNVRPDGQTIAGDQFAAALAAGHPPAAMPDYRLEVETCRTMASGFIVGLAVRGTPPGDSEQAAHVCQIVTVDDGKIVAWEEYLDTGQHAPFH